MSINLIYTLNDARQWAAFSGDYNPLHFDRQQARKIGGDQLSVHGMRAMLDMKRHLSAALLTTVSEQDCYIFSTRLRRPVWCQTRYHLQIAADGALITANLLDSNTQQHCFSGKLASAPPLVWAVGTQSCSLTLAQVSALAERFPGQASDVAQTWGFFDALLFQLLVKSPQTLAMLTTALPQLTATTLNELFTQLPVVQTHHETHFSGRLFTPDRHFHIAKRLYYVIQPLLVVGDKNHGLVLRAVIQAGTGRQPLITTTITLKTWPLAVN